MKYTVVICTFNRALFLEKAIRSLLRQTISKSEFMLIVVDNNSSDLTRQVVESFSDNDLEIKYVFESRQGISFARNRGAKESKTDYFLYLDDDAEAASDWLESFDLFQRENKDKFSCIAGHVSLNWAGGCKPSWYPEQYEPLLSGFDLGNVPRQMTKKNYLLTVNVALNRNDFWAIGGFREDLGRIGTSLISGEDVDLLHRFLDTGFRAIYLPEMKVTHMVTKERQTKSWLRKRLFWDGATQPYLDFGSAVMPPEKMIRRLFYDLKMLCLFTIQAPLSDKKYWLFFQRLGRVMSELKMLFRKIEQKRQ